jgi:hypothetical protein
MDLGSAPCTIDQVCDIVAAPSSSQQRSSYHYSPLAPGQIRLLQIDRIVEPSLQHIFPWLSPRATFKLRIFSVDLENTPDFLAVSYVWGTAPASVSVPVCNGGSLLVTPNVYEMLQYLESDGAQFWIDAICIDQTNPDEKATQIPLMHQIYSQASAVLVWLGASNPSAAAFMRDFARVYDLAPTWTPKDETNDPKWRGEDWPLDGDPFWQGLLHIAFHEWFGRLWTFQEVVLSKEAWLLYADTRIGLPYFVGFWHAGRVGPKSFIRVPERVRSQQVDIIHDACVMFSWRLGEEKATAVKPRDLPHMFYRVRHRKVKEQVDRVWAITGVLTESLRNSLSPKVDYSDEGRSCYWRTYILFAKGVYEDEQSLALLNMPPSVDCANTCLPSWCPDLYSTEALCDQQIQSGWHYPIKNRATHLPRAWYLNGNDENDDDDERKCLESQAAVVEHSLKLIKINNDSRVLSIRGFVVDKIVEVVDDTYHLFRQFDESLNRNILYTEIDNAMHKAVKGFYLRGLALARRVYCDTGNTPFQIPLNFVMCLFQDCRLSEEIIGVCEEVFDAFTPEGADRFKHAHDTRRDVCFQFWGHIMGWIGHSFFATEGGRFGVATPGCKPGDVVCVFYSGEPLYILPAEGTGPGLKPVRFGGTAFIPHLMDQDQRDDARLGPDEIFAMI